jgi:hypothetical protein
LGGFGVWFLGFIPLKKDKPAIKSRKAFTSLRGQSPNKFFLKNYGNRNKIKSKKI